MSSLRKRPPFPARAFWLSVAAFAGLSLLFQTVDWDLGVASHYYRSSPRWPGEHWAWSRLLYRFGEAPGVALGLLGGLAFALSFFRPGWRAWRGPGLYLFILLLLGPGLLVNGLSKALAGRPRPFEVQGLGGLWDYLRPFHFGTPGKGLSFLSGHVASAWMWLGLAWVWPQKRWIYRGALVFAALMAWGRVAQGAHWLSDVLLASALMGALAAGLSPLIHWQPSRRFWSRPGLGLALLCGTLAWLSLSHLRYEDRRFTAQWLRGQPAYLAPQERLLPWSRPEAPSEVAVDLSLVVGDLRLRFDQRINAQNLPLVFRARFQGQGIVGSREETVAEPLAPGDRSMPVGPQTLAWRFEQKLRGVWWNLSGDSELALPQDQPLDLRLKLAQGALIIGPLPAGRRVLISRLPEGSHAPEGFAPYGGSAWLREGADPLIALDVQAGAVRFE